MTDQEKKTSRWDTLAQELGADAKPQPKRPTPPVATTAPAPLPPAPAAAPVETPKRSGWDELTSWLGIGGAKKVRAEASPVAAAPSVAPSAPTDRPVEERPRRESAFRTEPLPRPESPSPTRSPRSEAIVEPVRESGPAIGTRGREFDDFRDALQEEQDVLRSERAGEGDEPLGERPVGTESGRGADEDHQRRRRRRRGGRGRGRGRSGDGERSQGDRPPRDPARANSGRPPEARRDAANEVDADFVDEDDHGDFDAGHHTDADIAAVHDAPAEPFDADEGDRGGHERSSEDGGRPRRRRRRRRGGRGRDGNRTNDGSRGSEAPAGARSSEFDDDFHGEPDHHDDDSSVQDRDRRIIHDSDDHIEHSESHHEDEHDAGEDFHQIHKGIPTWDEAVGHVINANMESRARNPHPQGGHRGGHRGGGRGRGGRDRH